MKEKREGKQDRWLIFPSEVSKYREAEFLEFAIDIILNPTSALAGATAKFKIGNIFKQGIKIQRI